MTASINFVSTNIQSKILAGNPFSSRHGDFVLLFAPLPPRSIRKSLMTNSLITRRKQASIIGYLSREGGVAESSVEPDEDWFEEVEIRKSIEEAMGDEEKMGIERLRSAAIRSERKKAERRMYLLAAMTASFGFTPLVVAAVYYRFAWQMEGSPVPLTEVMATFSLTVGAAVGMEYWARWAHRALWHGSLWHMHESHHRPRTGPFEHNDVFAIINAVPAIALITFGFFHRGLFSGICFGAGLGITLFGFAYMFVHDGLVHRRFPVGPIADVPYLQRVAAAHQIHHAEKFKGVPWGLFLGHKELEDLSGGMEELERQLNRRIAAHKNISNPDN